MQIKKSSSSLFTLHYSLPILIYSLFILNSSLNASTFFDKSTNLEWQDNSDVKTVKKDWSGAINYCKNLSLDGKSDWRLPSIDELLSITDDTKYKPAIISGFKNVVSGSYWSSSS